MTNKPTPDPQEGEVASYAEQAVLRADPALIARCTMALNQEAPTKPDSKYKQLATLQPDAAAVLAMPSLATQPGWTIPSDGVTDAMILSAVQAIWDMIADAYEIGLTPV